VFDYIYEQGITLIGTSMLEDTVLPFRDNASIVEEVPWTDGSTSTKISVYASLNTPSLSG